MDGDEQGLVSNEFESNWLTSAGAHLDLFEQEISRYLSGGIHALAVRSRPFPGTQGACSLSRPALQTLPRVKTGESGSKRFSRRHGRNRGTRPRPPSRRHSAGSHPVMREDASRRARRTLSVALKATSFAEETVAVLPPTSQRRISNQRSSIKGPYLLLLTSRRRPCRRYPGLFGDHPAYCAMLRIRGSSEASPAKPRLHRRCVGPWRSPAVRSRC